MFVYDYALGEWINISSWSATNGRYTYSGISSAQNYRIQVVYYTCPSHSWYRREINRETSTPLRRTFSAFYIGNGSDSDYTAFINGMQNRGFSGFTTRTTNASSTSGRPNGSIIRSATPNSAFVYISGHGFKQAYMPIYRDESRPLLDYYQAICAASAAVNFSDYPPINPPVSKYQIGAS